MRSELGHRKFNVRLAPLSIREASVSDRAKPELPVQNLISWSFPRFPKKPLVSIVSGLSCYSVPRA